MAISLLTVCNWMALSWQLHAICLWLTRLLTVIKQQKFQICYCLLQICSHLNTQKITLNRNPKCSTQHSLNKIGCNCRQLSSNLCQPVWDWLQRLCLGFKIGQFFGYCKLNLMVTSWLASATCKCEKNQFNHQTIDSSAILSSATLLKLATF